jgi:hypothetical protein
MGAERVATPFTDISGMVTDRYSKKCRYTRSKVKFTPEQATKAQRGAIYRSTLSLTSLLDGVGGQCHYRPLYPRKITSTHYGWVGLDG